MNATIVTAAANNRGFWFAECDDTCQSVFVHIKNVKGKRFLHVGDRIAFELAPNPRQPGEMEAVNVQWLSSLPVRAVRP